MGASAIPIANIYFLLSYAWDALPEADLVDVDASQLQTLPDLFATMLAKGTTHLLKRGIQREYSAVSDELSGIRGRVDLGASIRHASFERSRAWCTFDELGPDTGANRIIKATLRSLALVRGLDKGLADELRSLYRRMPGVKDVTVIAQSFLRLPSGNNARFYPYLLSICELVHANLLVDEGMGEHRFRDFTRNDRDMSALFQKFLFRFYTVERPDLKVSAPILHWNASGTAEDVAYVPRMWTDIVISGPNETIVADAKFYSRTLGEHHGAQRIHSENLYQLMAYLHHVDAPAAQRRGLLIYPRTTANHRIDVVIDEFPVRVATVDLRQAAAGIRTELLSLLTAEWRDCDASP